MFAIEKERATLTMFYNAANGSGWSSNGWLDTGTSLCTWYGITCDSTGNVQEINIQNDNLSGTIS